MGGLFGIRLSDRLSLNAEVTLDRSNLNGPIPIRQQWFFRTSLSPLIHLPAGAFATAIGPRVGLYSVSSDYDIGTANVEARDSGFSTGLNAGAFLPLSAQAAIGLLLSFDVMWGRRTCIATGAFQSGAIQQCGPTTDIGKVLGLAAGLLF